MIDLSFEMFSSSASMQGAKAEQEIPIDFDGNLEHIVLRERRKILLSRLFVKSQKPCVEVYSVEKQKSYLFSREAVKQSVLTITEASNAERLDAGNLHTGKIDHDLFCSVNTSKSEITGTSCTTDQSLALPSDNLHGAESGESEFSTSSDAQEIPRNKALPCSIQVNVEPFLSAEFSDGGKCVMKNVSSVVPVKKEHGVELSPARTCSFSVLRDLNYHNNTVSSTVKLGIDLSEPVKLSISESDDTGASCLMENKLTDEQVKGINSANAVSSLPSAICVKIETVLSSEIDNEGKTYQEKSVSPNMLPMQTEATFSMEAFEDELDHMSLLDRLMLLSTGNPPRSEVSKNRRCRSRNGSSILGLGRDVSESVESISVTCPRKLGIDLSKPAKLSISESNDTGASCLMENKPSDRQKKGTVSLTAVSSLPSAICVKIETVLRSEIDNEGKTYWEKSLSPNMLPMKTEATFSMEAFEDELDHMSLSDRLMLLSTETSPSSEVSKNLRCPSRNASSILGLGHGVSDSVGSISVTRPRKRRRTATNSAEMALEEDVPGLLKVLIDKGVSVEEIKLYGEPESDEAIDEAFCEDSFAELEAVIQKVFSHRESLLKVTPLCCSKGSKVTYCLGCLLSLVEQACYLRSQKWPVEWGWCRDLQAFIFVFQRHNRIVLERPEYGYATYFFELLDSLPVGWQIRRLVTTMKLTSCGRISLLENRPLKVGEDLSEGEARVLCQYGWVPNTGLATMLNYCGRVVHDTNKERDGNEWRLKIARMLVNGYNGGSVVPKFFLEKTMENESTPSPQVKLEI